MVKQLNLFLLLVALFHTAGYAQNDQLVSKKYLLKTSLTISPGFFLKIPVNLVYFHGHLEYFPEEKVSLRGDAFLGMNSPHSPHITANHCLQFGAFYHFSRGKFDPFLGFQPGINFSQIKLSKVPAFQTGITPMLSLSGGANYFVSRYFHFFLSMGYYKGTLLKMVHPIWSSSLEQVPVKTPLDEIRISGGLGFNIHVKKQ